LAEDPADCRDFASALACRRDYSRKQAAVGVLTRQCVIEINAAPGTFVPPLPERRVGAADFLFLELCKISLTLGARGGAFTEQENRENNSDSDDCPSEQSSLRCRVEKNIDRYQGRRQHNADRARGKAFLNALKMLANGRAYEHANLFKGSRCCEILPPNPTECSVTRPSKMATGLGQPDGRSGVDPRRSEADAVEGQPLAARKRGGRAAVATPTFHVCNFSLCEVLRRRRHPGQGANCQISVASTTYTRPFESTATFAGTLNPEPIGWALA
jgi:hypothetical protein